MLRHLLSSLSNPFSKHPHHFPGVSRPCLHCGTNTTQKKPFCSAEHLRAWRQDNPGNGRYVREQWREIKHDFDTPSRLFEMVDGDYIIKLDAFGDYTLLHWPMDKGQCALGIFDTLINAQRAASQLMRGMPITVH